MDAETVAVYEAGAREWERRRPPKRRELARDLAASVPDGEWRIDLGSGPGSHTADLGRPVVALDAAYAMVERARAVVPEAAVAQGDLERLPFRRAAFGGAWARASYLHVQPDRLPLALADLHRVLRVGAPFVATLARGGVEWAPRAADEFPGRRFAGWQPEPLRDVLTGAGFDVMSVDEDDEWLTVHARRARTLPDFVRSGLRLLLCGLNPSIYAADVGVGFARPGNRFWPAALAAGIVRRDRDPWDAIRHHAVGMTDLVKRATVGAAELTRDEYRAGAARLERLVAWIRPTVVCFAGLQGYRAVYDRRAQPGEQPADYAGARCYVMPNPSGLNTRYTVAHLAEHLRRAASLAG